MKTTIRKSLLVVLMLGTLICYAGKSTTSIRVIDAKKVKVDFMHVKKGHTLTIKDKNGTSIYSQKIKNTGNFSKIFDLNKLEDGKFTFELDKDFEIVKKPFIIKKDVVSFITNDEKTIFKPVIRNEKDLILISKIAFDNEPLEVILYYNNEVIFSEIIEGENILERAYRISENKVGNYRVVVHNVGRQYVKNFSI